MPKLLGFQIADHMGENIQGDDNDPSGLPSFHILNSTEAWAIIAAHGKSRSLLLQPIFEGDIEEPVLAIDPEVAAVWPADTSCVIDCDPVAIATIMIKSGCADAPYAGRDVDNPAWTPTSSEIAFWDKVSANADRIAKWALSGLGISRRAIASPADPAESDSTVATEGEKRNCPEGLQRVTDALISMM